MLSDVGLPLVALRGRVEGLRVHVKGWLIAFRVQVVLGLSLLLFFLYVVEREKGVFLHLRLSSAVSVRIYSLRRLRKLDR